MSVHEAAAGGYAVAADAYARGRPDYPDALASWLRETLGVGPGSQVLDLGAGTGKFTTRLVNLGADVIAVEPVAAMREQLLRAQPAVRVLAGTAQAIPLADASVDAVVCAQAFHWFADAAALRDIHRVLKPGGRLGLIWNVRDERCDWVAELTRLVTPFEGDAPRYYKGEWRATFSDPSVGDLFSPLLKVVMPHVHVGAPQQVIVDRFMSVSFIAALAPAARDGFETSLRQLIASHPALRDRESIAFPYVTECYCAHKRVRAISDRPRTGPNHEG